MAGEVRNDLCEACSDSGDDEDKEDFLGRKIHPDKAFKLLVSLTERKTVRLQCLRSRRRRKRSKVLAPVDFSKDSSTSSSRSRLEDECDQSDTFSEVKSSSSFGTSNFLGSARCDCVLSPRTSASCVLGLCVFVDVEWLYSNVMLVARFSLSFWSSSLT